MNVQDILDELKIPYKTQGQHHHATRGWLQIDCPFCSPDTLSYRMGINVDYLYCNCWHCGGHRIHETLKSAVGNSFTLQSLLRKLDPVRSISASSPEGFTGKELHVPKAVKKMTKHHRRYLEKRGFNPREIEKMWGVQGIGTHTKFPWSLWIPIHYRGQVVSWVTRTIQDDPGDSRYKFATVSESVYEPHSLLYGQDYVRNTIIVVEGPTDVWRIGPGAVALMGTGVAASKFQKISQYPRRIICLDSDGPGQRVAKSLISQLSVFPGETINGTLVTGKDPASAHQDEINELRRLLYD